jgi:hypothetical protein
MIVCGLLADNSVQRIVLRAVAGLFGGYVLGAVSGWIGMIVIRENLPATDPATVAATEPPQPAGQDAPPVDAPPQRVADEV